jgi:uncharacterized protein (UPF0264 family)
MRLLVSVASAAEAVAALAGGADVIDAKDPLSGAIGAVALDTFRDIHATVAGARLVTAAIGDATDETDVEQRARAYGAAGAALVKVGFAGIASAQRVGSLIAAAVRAASSDPGRVCRFGVVAVAYADAGAGGSSISRDALIDVAARAGAAGVLLDTADKNGAGLPSLLSLPDLEAWVSAARRAGLLVALAGKLTADDLAFVRDAGADIAGVRGAACDGGRGGRVSAGKVALLRSLCAPASVTRYETVEGRSL